MITPYASICFKRYEVLLSELEKIRSSEFEYWKDRVTLKVSAPTNFISENFKFVSCGIETWRFPVINFTTYLIIFKGLGQ